MVSLTRLKPQALVPFHQQKRGWYARGPSDGPSGLGCEHVSRSALIGMRVAVLLAASCSLAAGESVKLTAKTFEKKVYGSKNRAAFVKFQAPW